MNLLDRDVTVLVTEFGSFAASVTSATPREDVRTALSYVRSAFFDDHTLPFPVPTSRPSATSSSSQRVGIDAIDKEESFDQPTSERSLRTLAECSARLLRARQGGADVLPALQAAFLRHSYASLVSILIGFASQGVFESWSDVDTLSLVTVWLAPTAEAPSATSIALPARDVLKALAPHIQDFQARPRTGTDSISYSSNGVSVTDLGSALAGRVFAEHFLLPESRGLMWAVSELTAGRERGSSVEEVAAALAGVVERIGSRDALHPLLHPSSYVFSLTRILIAIAPSSSQNRPSAQLLAAIVSRLSRRGFAMQAAFALRLAACELPAASDALSTVLQSITDPRGLEKLLEALLVTTVCPLTPSTSPASDPLDRLLHAARAALGHPPTTLTSTADHLPYNDDHLKEALTLLALAQPKSLQAFLGPEILKRRPLPLASLALLLDVFSDPRLKSTNPLLNLVTTILPLWAPEAFVSSTPTPQHAWATTILLSGLYRLRRQLGSEGLSVFLSDVLKGVGSRLGSPIHGVRLQGLRMGNLLSHLIDVQVGPSGDADATSDLFGDQNPWSMAAEELWPLILGPKYGSSDFVRTLQKEGVALPESLLPPKPEGDLATGGGAGGEVELGPAAAYAKKVLEEATAPDSDDDEGDRGSFASFDDDGGVPLEALDLSEGEEEDWRPDPETGARPPAQLKALAADIRNPKDAMQVLRALKVTEQLVRSAPSELAVCAEELARSLLYCRVPDWAEDTGPVGDTAEDHRLRSIAAILAQQPTVAGPGLIADLYSSHVDMSQRLLVLDCICLSAREMAKGVGRIEGATSQVSASLPLSSTSSDRGPKTRVFAPTRLQQLKEGSPEAMYRNRFGDVAVQWTGAILSGLSGSGRGQGIDLFGRDFVLLGRLLTTLGTFAECSGISPATPRVAAAVLELLQAPPVADHTQPYVRRAALLAGVQILSSLPPASIAGDKGGSTGGTLTQRLGWLREWAQQRLDQDADEQVRVLASGCLQLQRNLASRALDVLAAAPKTVQQLIEDVKPSSIKLPWKTPA